MKIFGPLIWTVHRAVLFAAQGPVFKTDRGVFAVRYAGMGEVRQVTQYYRIDKARSLDEWETGHAPSGAAQHQLRLRRREGQYRLSLQRPVPDA